MNRDTTAPKIAWPAALAAAAVLGSIATACMMPFVAVATVAAASMPRREALTAVVGVWAVNQLLGFGLLGYPMTSYAITWGLALGAAALAALVVARRVLREAAPTALALTFAFGIAFGTYEGLLFAFSLLEGGTDTFTPPIVLSILANDAAWLLGLATLHALLTRAAPRVFGAPRALRLV